MRLVKEMVRIAPAAEVGNAARGHDERTPVDEKVLLEFGERVIGRIVPRRGGRAEPSTHLPGRHFPALDDERVRGARGQTETVVIGRRPVPSHQLIKEQA